LVRSGARTLDLRFGISAFVLCAMWDDESPLNFDHSFCFSGRNGAEDPRPSRNPSGRRLVAGSRAEKNCVLFIVQYLLNNTSFCLLRPCRCGALISLQKPPLRGSSAEFSPRLNYNFVLLTDRVVHGGAALPFRTAVPNHKQPWEKMFSLVANRMFARDCAHAGGPAR
jgi:hypothetical protein